MVLSPHEQTVWMLLAGLLSCGDLPLAPVNTSLLYALLFNACMFGVAWFMWRKKWFVKV